MVSARLGSVKLQVPTATAVAPARMNSTASCQLLMPPMPMRGTFTAWATWYTMRTATGCTAGPERPPTVFPSTGRCFQMSIFIPTRVLMREMASVPAASTARAISVMSVTLGDSLVITGLWVRALAAFTTSPAAWQSVPKARPPWATLGQEMFSSMASTPSTSSISARVP